MAGVGALVDDHAGVGTQLPGELAVADIDRMDPQRAVGEQHVGEAAGGSADVEADPSLRAEAERRQPVRELETAA